MQMEPHRFAPADGHARAQFLFEGIARTQGVAECVERVAPFT
jgi:hypothetical protein